MQRRDDLGTFSDSAANALDGSRADVAHGEHARDCGFEWRSRASLAFGGLRAGEDEATFVQTYPASLEPFGQARL